NHRFWRPLFYQLELRPCNKRGVVYKVEIKGKGFFYAFDAIAQIPNKSRLFVQQSGITCCICSPAGVGMGHKWG
ncbi:hypothetical protein, partial [Aeromonas veronii]|uniref:hypothetical protein n=1 Tax=Aeromonas veronii TaxID=654 RepID=UPI003BA214FA